MESIMKRLHHILYAWLLIAMMVVVSFCNVNAQGKKTRQQFDPQRFEIDLEQYITAKAGLTPQEAAKFFPVYRKMNQKQRMLFDEMNFYRFVDSKDNKAAEKAVRRKDEIDIEIRLLQQEYHNRFMTMLPAGKVMLILKAEEVFHREAFKRMKH